ncbi:cytochrome P450 [Actinophytocola algeriensis]|uniref:Cytochrome P450 n=1 Tax=Actinophytocola algeriensis TaxID=1768010 RepID=A0A7W7VCK3_9PSEU|nr:cytochrome P450 [Actinophytocola algeriensis]MBB4905157.1 cytochrome P450 [Actinophytocola algeriensis]MBE1473158.1 cytochrome P450 [Actinophytocola algeriensis]
MNAPIEGLPTTRQAGCPFDPPHELARLRETRPLARMVYPDGHVGWLATSHETVRAVLADSRFSARYELMHLPVPGGPAELPPASPGDMTGIDAPEHTRFRQLLAGKFTVRRMGLLTDRVGQVCAELLDDMARQGPPTDLVPAFTQPVPALMICELLGVPYADHEFFQEQTLLLTSTSASMDARGAAMDALYSYLHDLVLAKRKAPTDDLLSDLTTSDLDDVELAGLGSFLLGAGLDTTSNMLALGTFALLTDPEQLADLRSGWCTPEQAVEELLRYLTIAHTGVRAALADVELGGEVVRAGESVTISLQAANRDPARYPEPDTLDLSRRSTGHVALGYGIHQCLGQQLARVEMRVAFPALFERFPTLRLAADPADVPLRTDSNLYGVHALPVAW